MLSTIVAWTTLSPTGLFLSAPDPEALAHPQARGTLIRVRWEEIESERGKYDFQALDRQLARIAGAKKLWALGVVAGQHAPDYLQNDPQIPKLSFNFRGERQVTVPVQWNGEVQARLKALAAAISAKYGSDPKLALVYVPQMTANGIEGHFNGCPESTLKEAGFTEDGWVKGVTTTARDFANAFKGKALAVEVHEVLRSSTPAKRILDEVYRDPAMGKRVGAAIWWLSGRESYQSSLLKVIEEFPGAKYGQMIASSDRTDQFGEGGLPSALAQAKKLGLQYIEPWEKEFKQHQFDSEFDDYTQWADRRFGGG